MKDLMGEDIKLYFTSDEMFNIYFNNKNRHLISNNKELLLWLKENLFLGYKPKYDIDKMQQFIEDISCFYIEEAKRIDDLSKLNINFNTYIHKLTFDSNDILNPRYAGIGNYIVPDPKNRTKEYIFLRLINKNTKETTLLKVNRNTGKTLTVFDNYNMSLYGKNIDDIYKVFKYKDLESKRYTKNSIDLDYSEVEKCVLNHKLDIELRNYLLESAILRIVYNKEMRPEINFEIAESFIKDLNESLYDCDLKYDKLDKITSKDYSEYEETLNSSIFDKIYTKKLNNYIKKINKS